jgi:predicted glutamine amidotransferase
MILLWKKTLLLRRAAATVLLQLQILQPSHASFVAHQRAFFYYSPSSSFSTSFKESSSTFRDDIAHTGLTPLPATARCTRSTTSTTRSTTSTTALSCQLLGINCANPTAEFALSWPSFCQRGGNTDIHADGWGLAYYQGHGLRTFHDTEPASTSALARFLGQQPIQTSNMLAHIRYATSGRATDLANVHPFSREMWAIQWCFCHNGQVPLFDDFPNSILKSLQQQDDPDNNDDEDTTTTFLNGATTTINGGGASQPVNGDGATSSKTTRNRHRRNDDHYKHDNQHRTYFPIGDTDSEATFCAILNALRAKFTDTMPSLPILQDALQRLCQEIVNYNREATILNFMLTCGPHVLWVYSWPGKRPGGTVWNGLHYTVRAGSSNLSDEDYSINVKSGSNDNGSGNDRVCIVATSPLTDDEEWVELKRGELILMDDGKPHVSVADLFRVELHGHGLRTYDENNDGPPETRRRATLPPPRLEEDMRRYQFQADFFTASGI